MTYKLSASEMPPRPSPPPVTRFTALPAATRRPPSATVSKFSEPGAATVTLAPTSEVSLRVSSANKAEQVRESRGFRHKRHKHERSREGRKSQMATSEMVRENREEARKRPHEKTQVSEKRATKSLSPVKQSQDLDDPFLSMMSSTQPGDQKTKTDEKSIFSPSESEDEEPDYLTKPPKTPEIKYQDELGWVRLG